MDGPWKCGHPDHIVLSLEAACHPPHLLPSAPPVTPLNVTDYTMGSFRRCCSRMAAAAVASVAADFVVATCTPPPPMWLGANAPP